MEVIDNYLDVMFSRFPLTPQTTEAKAELRAMMEDAYNGALAAGRSQNEAVGLALSEFGNLDEVAPLLGITALPSQFAAAQEGTDASAGITPPSARPAVHHGPANPEHQGSGAQGPHVDQRPKPVITLAQAMNFAEVLRRSRWLLAVGIAILVVSVGPLIGLILGASSPSFPISEGAATAIGMSFLLLFIAIGAGMLVWRSQMLTPFVRITDQSGVPAPGVEAWAEDLRSANASRRTLSLVIAIALWIGAALPIIVAALLVQGLPQEQQDPWLGLGLMLTLLLVAAGLLVFLPANWAESTAGYLTGPAVGTGLSEDEYNDRYPVWARAFFAGYWPLVTTVYLAWSFITFEWGTTWIIWPIAGVFFAAVAATLGAVYSKPKVN